MIYNIRKSILTTKERNHTSSLLSIFVNKLCQTPKKPLVRKQTTAFLQSKTFPVPYRRLSHPALMVPGPYYWSRQSYRS